MYTKNKFRDIKRIIKNYQIDELKNYNFNAIFRNKTYRHNLFGEIKIKDYLFYYALEHDSFECAEYMYFNLNLNIDLVEDTYFNTLSQDKINMVKILSRIQKITKIKERIN